jgi:hypothetical protein
VQHVYVCIVCIFFSTPKETSARHGVEIKHNLAIPCTYISIQVSAVAYSQPKGLGVLLFLCLFSAARRTDDELKVWSAPNLRARPFQALCLKIVGTLTRVDHSSLCSQHANDYIRRQLHASIPLLDMVAVFHNTRLLLDTSTSRKKQVTPESGRQAISIQQ